MTPAELHRSRRITLVANEVRGCQPCGGLGTSTTNIALALADLGHRVEVLYFGPSRTPPDAGWMRVYDERSVRIRMLARSGERVEPPWFVDARDVEAALREDPADVVITQDGAAPAYTAVRLRTLGRDFHDTRVVVVCHGTRGWIKDVSRNVRVFPHLLHLMRLEQASIELADAVVSPSAYLVDWMRAQGWKLPTRTVVIPHPVRTGAVGRLATSSTERKPGEEVERVSVFGRLDERKGVRPFAAALDALEPELLARVEVEFVGPPIPMRVADVEALLSARTKSALRGLSFATELDQHEALERLRRPRTLVVVPSLEDNSPNTVSECLALGIPFIASARGGTAELVAPEDRARVLFEPTAEGIEDALRRALTDGALRPAAPAFDEEDAVRAWSELVSEPTPSRLDGAGEPAVDVVVCPGRSGTSSSRCLRALSRQRYENFRVLAVGQTGPGPDGPGPDGRAGVVPVACASRSRNAQRRAGLEAATAPWVVLLEPDDEPDEELLRMLVRAQTASGADAVSCGLLVENDAGDTVVRLFSGAPAGLGVLGNDYGQVTLLRRRAVAELGEPLPAEDDPDWPLLAALSASGAKVVSIPSPLLRRRAQPGSLRRSSSDALLVVGHFERTLPPAARSLARLAAGLAASSDLPAPDGQRALVARVLDVVREEGVVALARRGARRSRRALRREGG